MRPTLLMHFLKCNKASSCSTCTLTKNTESGSTARIDCQYSRNMSYLYLKNVQGHPEGLHQWSLHINAMLKLLGLQPTTHHCASIKVVCPTIRYFSSN